MAGWCWGHKAFDLEDSLKRRRPITAGVEASENAALMGFQRIDARELYRDVSRMVGGWVGGWRLSSKSRSGIECGLGLCLVAGLVCGALFRQFFGMVVMDVAVGGDSVGGL